ncbi:beta-galactosidase [Photobacterium rosenbergii]|uniref:beta-galactosidase n=1 Tax=Photobacterium rosenbergii TaxID=294936 RepID=UPI0028F74C3D|nr:beta-galactosidase [Photobacterium rosenbergii]
MSISMIEPTQQVFPLKEHRLFNIYRESLPSEITFLNTDGFISPVGDDKYGVRIVSYAKDNFYTATNLEPATPWDWSQLPNFSFAFDASNLTSHSTQVFINIFNTQGEMHSRSITIPASRDTKTYITELKGEYLKGKTNHYSGLRSNPAPINTPYEYATWMWGSINMDLTSISKVELSIHGSLLDHELVLSNFRLVLSPPANPEYLTGIIDQFGQNAKVDYGQKVHSEEQLLALRDAELEALKSGRMAQRSQFSGYTGAGRFDATGYFRTEKIDGKWSLIDPEGYPYFATGIDIIRLANAYTMTGIDYDHNKIAQRQADDLTPEDSIEKVTVSDEAKQTAFTASKVRRNCFNWLPSYDDPLAEHYGYMRELWEGPTTQGETFSFYAANLQRKYGENYRDKWSEVTIDRMLNWGFTCLGNWAAPEFYRNEKIPFFANGWIIGDFKTVSSGDDFWTALPDPFDPLFEQRAIATVQQVKDEIQDSPWCVGVFIDNEKSWGRMGTIEGQYGIPIHTLSRDAAESPTKAVFMTVLQGKYQTVAALNQAWATDFASWEVIAKGIKGLAHNDTQLEDYGLLLETYASEYFRIVSQAVKAELPNHLYLGARFADWGMTPEVVRACAKHTDVVSYNYYKEGLHPEPWKFLEEIDMPSIIGEFHFGARDTGFFHPGLVSAENQDERGEMYERYVQSVIDNPYFVGCHYFQYIDSPITGRSFDGENYNIGFVSVTDVPYDGMVNAAKTINSSLYQQRLNPLTK